MPSSHPECLYSQPLTSLVYTPLHLAGWKSLGGKKTCMYWSLFCKQYSRTTIYIVLVLGIMSSSNSLQYTGGYMQVVCIYYSILYKRLEHLKIWDGVEAGSWSMPQGHRIILPSSKPQVIILVLIGALWESFHLISLLFSSAFLFILPHCTHQAPLCIISIVQLPSLCC